MHLTEKNVFLEAANGRIALIRASLEYEGAVRRAAHRQTGPRRKASMKRRAWCSQQSAAACMAAYARLRCRTMKAHADERAMCGGIPRACILASCLNNQAVLVLRAQPGAQSFARRRRARRAASTDQARAGRRSFETISNFGFVLSVPD